MPFQDGHPNDLERLLSAREEPSHWQVIHPQSPAGLRILITCVLVIANAYRAHTQSITIDEAFTYFRFVAVPFREMIGRFDANNHILNTVLAKLSIALFGLSEFTIRIPSLMGGLLFLVASQRVLVKLFGERWLTLLVCCALWLNPIVLDYLSVARGYSLALGFQFLAIDVLLGTVASLQEVVAGCLFGLSIASNLTFMIPNGILMALWVLPASGTDWNSLIKRTLGLFGAFFATTAMILTLPLAHAKGSNFYIGEDSAARSLTIMLMRSFHFPFVPFAYSVSDFITSIAVPMILCGAATALLVSRRKPHVQMIPLAFLGCLAALLILHVFFGIPYPYERTGIYLIPLATLTLAISAADGSGGIVPRAWRTLATAFLCLIVAQYGLEWKVDRYEEWAFDAGTKRTMAALYDVTQNHRDKPVRVGVSWVLEQSVNWYKTLNRWDWMEPVTRADDLKTRDFDYFYLITDDQNLIQSQRLKVYYSDPVSHTVLAGHQTR